MKTPYNSTFQLSQTGQPDFITAACVVWMCVCHCPSSENDCKCIDCRAFRMESGAFKSTGFGLLGE